MTVRRSVVALVTVVVAAGAAGAALPALPASSAPAGAVAPDCGGVTVVVDGNELGGGVDSTCVSEPGVATELFADAGVTLEYQPQLQDFVCRVDGRPVERPCTDGDSYWSLWWAEPGGEWVYATLGVASLEVPEGGSLGFAWHEGDDNAAPPDVAVGAAAAKTPSADPGSAPAAEEGTGSGDDQRLWLAGGLAVLVLGAAAVVTVLRRRSA